MDPKNIEKAAVYTLVAVIAAIIIAVTVALVVHYSNDSPNDVTDDNRQTTIVANSTGDKITQPDTGDVTTGPDTDAETSDTDSDETSTTGTEPVTEAVVITKYDEPKTMYALYNINARVSYTTESNIMGLYYQNDEVTVTGITDNGWYEIQYKGIYTAYIRCDLLTEDPNQSEVTVTAYAASKIMYATSNVNVRESYSANSTSFKMIDAGTEVTVLGETSNGWYQIEYEDGVAYIKSDYLSNSMPSINTEATTDREA